MRVEVAPTEDLTRALALGKEILGALPGVLETPPVAARVQELGDSSVELRFLGWVDQTVTDFGKARSEAVRLVKEGFDAAGVKTPPPEYGIRILDPSPDSSPGTDPLPQGTRQERPKTPVPQSAEDPGEADLAPDTTIEEEIERELRESSEENLLKDVPPTAGHP